MPAWKWPTKQSKILFQSPKKILERLTVCPAGATSPSFPVDLRDGGLGLVVPLEPGGGAVGVGVAGALHVAVGQVARVQGPELPGGEGREIDWGKIVNIWLSVLTRR